jgi:DNA-binding transcriptional LysR family regulator
VLVLTDAGAALAAAGADVTLALQRARLVATELAEHPRGEVSLSAFASAAEAFFPGLARTFPPSGPVQVRLTDEDVAQVGFPRLTTGVDIVLAHRMDHSPRWPRSVTATRLLHEPLDIAIPVDHPLAQGVGALSPRDVADQPWISTHADYPVVAMVEAIGATVGMPPNIVHRVNDFTIASHLVRAGAGIALIPRWTMPTPEGVRLRPLRGLAARRSIDALIRPENRIRPAVQEVLKHLKDESARISGTANSVVPEGD